jgi:hypothetical protein
MVGGFTFIQEFLGDRLEDIDWRCHALDGAAL